MQREKEVEPTQAVQEMSVAFARFMPEQAIPTISVTGEISYVAPEEGYFLLTVEEVSIDMLDSAFSQLGEELRDRKSTWKLLLLRAYCQAAC